MPLTVSTQNVLQTSGERGNGIAGESLIAGQLCYRKSEDGKYYKAQADGTAEEATIAGVTLNVAAANQPIWFATSGVLTIGADFDVGMVIIAGATAGGLHEVSEQTDGDFVSVVGVTTATQLKLGAFNSGVEYVEPA
jgi:hypothetical protein